VARRTARTPEHVGRRQLCSLTLALVPGIHKALSRSVDNQSIPITCVATTKHQISLESLSKCHLPLVRAHCVSIISPRAESVCPYFTNVKWTSSTTPVIPEEAEVLSFQRPVRRRNRQRRAQRSPRSVEQHAGMPGAADSPHLGHSDVLAAACRAPPRPQTKAFQVINQTGLEDLRRLMRCDATASNLPDHSASEFSELSRGPQPLARVFSAAVHCRCHCCPACLEHAVVGGTCLGHVTTEPNRAVICLSAMPVAASRTRALQTPHCLAYTGGKAGVQRCAVRA